MAEYISIEARSGEVNIPKVTIYSPRLKRIIVLVHTHEVISTKSKRKPLKSTI